MSDVRAAESGLSVLSLRFEVAHSGPDWPVVSIEVDGLDPFQAVADGWLGFDPATMLSNPSALLPTSFGQRVAVKRCSCGVAGCGVIAPAIVASPDGRRISWIDFRDYTGVFIGPLCDEARDYEGEPWNLADMHFDADQYIAEVGRAQQDRSWETPRRQVARLVHEELTDIGAVIPPNLELHSVYPAWGVDDLAVDIVFMNTSDVPGRFKQQVLRLTSQSDGVDDAAAQMIQQLLNELPDAWVRLFGCDPTVSGR